MTAKTSQRRLDAQSARTRMIGVPVLPRQAGSPGPSVVRPAKKAERRRPGVLRAPDPREVKALRLDVVRQARESVRDYCTPTLDGGWWGPRLDIHGPRWVRSEVRLIRNLILRDLAQLEYELRHGIGRRMPKKRRK